jgi:hypothetical protein
MILQSEIQVRIRKRYMAKAISFQFEMRKVAIGLNRV